MSGDSVPLVLPLSRFASKACEATTLYRELRKPLLRYLVCLGLSPDEGKISRSEPDTSLFAVPSDFKMIDGPKPIIYHSFQ